MNEIEVKAVVAKVTVDEKKAVLNLEVAVSSWGELPKLTEIVGGYVDVSISETED